MLEHNKLIQLVNKYPMFRSLTNDIKNSEIELAIVFGSYAKGIPNKQSDIDLFLLTKNRNIKNKIEFTNSKLSVKIGDFDKNNLLIKEIIKDHVIIKGVEKYYELISQKTN